MDIMPRKYLKSAILMLEFSKYRVRSLKGKLALGELM